MADAILDSRQSIAHLGGPENEDELIEIDESGAPIDSVQDTRDKSKIAKKGIKKKIQIKAKSVKISDVEVQEVVPDDDQKISEKDAKKTAVKKKIAKKTTKKISKKTAVKTETED